MHSGLFQSPPTSAHGELVEPSATVLRQAQDERLVDFHNFEKALPCPCRGTTAGVRMVDVMVARDSSHDHGNLMELNITVNGNPVAIQVQPVLVVARRTAGFAWIDGRQARLRPGRVRVLHRVAGWQTCKCLPGSGLSRRRRRQCCDHRGSGFRRDVIGAAAVVPRRRWGTMRFLHAGIRDGHQGVAKHQSHANR